MRYIKGLYVSLVLMMIAILVNTTIFNDEFSGVAMFVSLGVFIVGTAFYVNARQLKVSDEEK